MTTGSPMEQTRENAISVLRQRAKRLRIAADRLEALANELPESLSEEAEAALWAVSTHPNLGHL